MGKKYCTGLFLRGYVLYKTIIFYSAFLRLQYSARNHISTHDTGKLRQNEIVLTYLKNVAVRGGLFKIIAKY